MTFQSITFSNHEDLPYDNPKTDNKIYGKTRVKKQQQQHNLEKVYKLTEYENRKNAIIEESVTMINSSKMPIIVAGIEIQRFELQKKLLNLIEKTNIPFVSTILSKSVLNEDHPLFLGVYEGSMGSPALRQFVESSDCLLMLGAPITEPDFYITSNPIRELNCINITNDTAIIKNHKFEKIYIQDFIDALIESPLTKRDKLLKDIEEIKDNSLLKERTFHQNHTIKDKRITINHLFSKLNSFITKSTIVISDTGDALFGSLNLNIKNQTEFLASAYYLSMGFAVPASIGAQLANASLRPIVLVGDGAFQMTGMEISTIARFNLNPIIFILNNKGYGTERQLLDGSFNDVLSWNYSLLPNVIGQGKGFLIETEWQLDNALNEIQKNHVQDLCILDVRLDKGDHSNAIYNPTKDLQKNIK
jgi:indolepyruvate decarboxylase